MGSRGNGAAAAVPLTTARIEKHRNPPQLVLPLPRNSPLIERTAGRLLEHAFYIDQRADYESLSAVYSIRSGLRGPTPCMLPRPLIRPLLQLLQRQQPYSLRRARLPEPDSDSPAVLPGPRPLRSPGLGDARRRRVIPTAKPSPAPIHAPGPGESRSWNGTVGERGGWRSGSFSPARRVQRRRRGRRSSAAGEFATARSLPTPPVPESRGRGAGGCGEGAAHRNLPPDYLRPPSPEKNAPRADGLGEGRNVRSRRLRSPWRSRRCSASGLRGSEWAPAGQDPPTRPRSHGPRSRRVAAVRESVGGTRGPIIIISPRTACLLPRRKKTPPGPAVTRGSNGALMAGAGGLGDARGSEPAAGPRE